MRTDAAKGRGHRPEVPCQSPAALHTVTYYALAEPPRHLQ
jgi:hypothetical protein